MIHGIVPRSVHEFCTTTECHTERYQGPLVRPCLVHLFMTSEVHKSSGSPVAWALMRELDHNRRLTVSESCTLYPRSDISVPLASRRRQLPRACSHLHALHPFTYSIASDSSNLPRFPEIFTRNPVPPCSRRL